MKTNLFLQFSMLFAGIFSINTTFCPRTPNSTDDERTTRRLPPELDPALVEKDDEFFHPRTELSTKRKAFEDSKNELDLFLARFGLTPEIEPGTLELSSTEHEKLTTQIKEKPHTDDDITQLKTLVENYQTATQDVRDASSAILEQSPFKKLKWHRELLINFLKKYGLKPLFTKSTREISPDEYNRLFLNLPQKDKILETFERLVNRYDSALTRLKEVNAKETRQRKEKVLDHFYWEDEALSGYSADTENS